ncbi:MAG: S8 family serine peptidase [Bacteroidetes bacterium]|nr:S8 family serine peptidase [Bacteroidota bacterium]
MNNRNRGENVYYYYNNQKVYYNVTYKQMVIGFAEGRSFQEIRSMLASVAQLPIDSIKPTALKNQVQVRLNELTATEKGKAVIDALKNNKLILYARPCINGLYGKLSSYGNEFIVKLKPAVSVMQLNVLINQHDCKMMRSYMFDNATFIIGAGNKNGYDGLKMANIFFESGLFEFSEPDLENYQMKDDPNDPLYYLQWDHKNTGSADQYNGVPGADMNVDSAWGITKGKGSIIVAVIDEGVDTGHVELKSHMVQGFDATTLTSNIGDGRPLSSNNAHGTNCAGIIGALDNNGVGIAGIAPKCKIMPVNLADANGYFTTNSNMAAGIDYAWTNGADVLSNSWGGGSVSSAIDDAIHRTVTQGRNGKGSIVVFAAGNNNAGMSYPALNSEVIAVGGINMCNQREDPNSCDGEYWWGASYGEGLSVAAPCVKIPSTDISGAGGYSTNDYYTIFNGTSAATPHVAAVAALVLSVNSSYTKDQVRTIIENTTDKIPGYNFKLTPGYNNGTWNNELGYGRVDAYHAVLAAQNGKFCNVQIAAGSATRFCDGDSVKLSVVNPGGGVNYKWYKNGVATNNAKTTITIKESCEYYVAATYSNGCVAYSSPITITEVKSAGTLIADAGKDISLCTGVSGVRIGSMEAAKGGMPYLNEKRAYAMDWYTNNFYRFSLSNPSSIDTIAKNVVNSSDKNNGYFFSGGDFTPYGYYAITRITNKLFRIDTLNGSQQLINTITPASGEWVGLAWDPQRQQLYAASSFGTQTQIYTVDIITGNVQFVATVPIYYVIWIAFNNEGQMYALCNNDRRIYKINKTTGEATGLPSIADSHLGYAQDADFDPISDSLYLTAMTAGQNYVGDLRLANTQTGTATSIGVIGNTNYNEMDATAIAGNTYKYTWKPAAGLSDVHDPNPWASPSKNTTYTLTVKDMCGNQATSKIKVTINANKPFVKITAPEDTICSGQKIRLSATAKDNYYYQWYLNGNPIANATDSFYVAKRAGTYKVHVYAGLGGCDKMSAPFKLNKCAGNIANYSSDDAIALNAENKIYSLFPNPANNVVTITLPVSNRSSAITVYDMNGKIVLHKEMISNNAAVQINISKLAAGAYRVTWHQDDQQYSWKLIKQ